MSSVAVVIRERGGGGVVVTSWWLAFIYGIDFLNSLIDMRGVSMNHRFLLIPTPHSASTPSEHEVKLMFLLYYLESHGGRLKINFHSSSNWKLMDIFSDTVLK